eukprot:scaffold258339_cov40-Tisochrysis_lutea.AAC.2
MHASRSLRAEWYGTDCGGVGGGMVCKFRGIERKTTMVVTCSCHGGRALGQGEVSYELKSRAPQ